MEDFTDGEVVGDGEVFFSADLEGLEDFADEDLVDLEDFLSADFEGLEDFADFEDFFLRAGS